MMTWLNHNRTRGNILIVLNTFVIFLVLFENELVIPVWLQPIGRMHAMFVHFPIVLILIAMGLEFFRAGGDNPGGIYSVFGRELLFAGVVLSGATVIMGVFLSREDGYNSEALVWHKWAGVLVFFLSSLIYSIRGSSWSAPVLIRVCAVITTLIVVIAGHLGGELTHGDNFVLAPIARVSQVRTVDVEDAIIFDHVVRPVLERKCISCHNEDKHKGELLLTDSVAMSRGGKTGKLFIPGEPGKSLLLNRMSLPLEDDKHMPPRDKQQLTQEERDLLFYWIRSGAGFKQRVSLLPETDSLRIAAVRTLKRLSGAQQAYDFPPATEQVLARLNSNYRVIRPVSKASPALTVNIYNRSSYSSVVLEELTDVQRQVIALDAGKMPVDDKDLLHVSRFENLEKLNLNFTDITGAGLSHLRRLTHLEHLSLSGTLVTYPDVQRLLRDHPNLRSIAVWETRLSPDDIIALQKEFPRVKLVGAVDEKNTLIKLNPPKLANKLRVFDDSIQIDLFHPVPGTEIRFTTDGSEPDSLSGKLFSRTTFLSETTAIRAKAYKKGWLSSDISVLNVYKSSRAPDTVILLSKLNRVHVANGAKTFFDHELGSFNANSPAWANNWGGIRNNDLELLLEYDAPREISSVSVNTLIETENVIFPPGLIEVWGGNDESDLTLIGMRRIILPTVYRKPYIELFRCDFDTASISNLKIIVKPVMKIPAWHKNKDKAALMLVDEILIN